jgi:hypothetical protein
MRLSSPSAFSADISKGLRGSLLIGAGGRKAQAPLGIRRPLTGATLELADAAYKRQEMLAVWSFPENIAFPVAEPNLETRRLSHRSSMIGHYANDHRDVSAMGFLALQLIKKL